MTICGLGPSSHLDSPSTCLASSDIPAFLLQALGTDGQGGILLSQFGGARGLCVMERESEMGEQEAGVRTFCILVNALAACDSSVVDCALWSGRMAVSDLGPPCTCTLDPGAAARCRRGGWELGEQGSSACLGFSPGWQRALVRHSLGPSGSGI